jgi:hypothetical protein
VPDQILDIAVSDDARCEEDETLDAEDQKIGD